MRRYFKGTSLVYITHFHLERIKQMEVKNAHNMNLRKKGFSPSVQCGEMMVGRDI